jgi:hypothetical protein
MNKSGGTAGAAIITNAANFPDEGVVADFLGWHIGEIKIDGLAHHVLALCSHVSANALQEGIGLRRAITANNMNRGARAQIGVQLPYEVDGLGINGDHFVATPIAHEVIDFLHGRGNIAAFHHVGDGDAFLGVYMIEGNRTGFAASNCRCAKAPPCSNRQRCNDGG